MTVRNRGKTTVFRKNVDDSVTRYLKLNRSEHLEGKKGKYDGRKIKTKYVSLETIENTNR